MADEAVGVRLFVPPGHHYSPVADPAEAAEHLARLQAGGMPAALPGIRLDLDAMRELWGELVPHMQDMPFVATPAAGLRYGLENPNFAWADGTVLHGMLRHFQPRRYFEIGCGWSSACALDTFERYVQAGCEMVLIEPYPQLVHSLLGTPGVPLTLIQKRVQEVPTSLFAMLGAGDVLFIDSTHVLRTGSDVCFELFEILPRLASGVLVHFHDVFWPFEYPEDWVLDENRSWNELYALRAYLTNNADWEILFFSDYFVSQDRGLAQATCPEFLRNRGGSLWLRRT